MDYLAGNVQLVIAIFEILMNIKNISFLGDIINLLYVVCLQGNIS